MAMATVMVFGSNGLSALAADGEAPTAPKDAADGNPSSGHAIAESNDGEVWKVKDDDDNTAAAMDGETDISIWAKVVENGDYVYKVDIKWGNMMFEFNNQVGTWNTETHTYDATNQRVGAEWTETGFIDGINNKIEVENHSNWAVNTLFSYNHEGEQFNENVVEGDNSVRGHFFLDNMDAQKAAKVLIKSENVDNALEDVLTLGHQDATNAVMYGGTVDGEGDIDPVTTNTEGSCKRSVFFTFNGTPDIDYLSDTLKKDFTKVGVITVTISPCDAPEDGE